MAVLFLRPEGSIISVTEKRTWEQSGLCPHVERVMGIEPTSQPWEGRILPMNYTRATPAL